MTIVFALTALAAEPNFGPIVIGQPRPAEPKTVCVPASDLDWRCKAVPLTVAEVPGNVAMELCRENVQRVIFATLILPGGHAVPGSMAFEASRLPMYMLVMPAAMFPTAERACKVPRAPARAVSGRVSATRATARPNTPPTPRPVRKR